MRQHDFAKFTQVGIVGLPPRSVIARLNQAGVVIHDLDARLVEASLEGISPLLPKVYCAILRTVVLNAVNLQLDAIFIDVGPGKCDGALQVAAILEDTLPLPVIRTKNTDTQALGHPLCLARQDLTEKFLAITEGAKRATPPAVARKPCKPKAGFWGVPPRDFSLLAPFPPATHIYGWSRCLENKTPADAALEAYCNPQVPTVFFAQSFCAKTALAKHLARRHPLSLYLDVDFNAGGSALAKVQAFLELSGALA